jgi:cytidylate kinase
VGRGGQAILRDQPGTLHVRVIAPMETRMQVLRNQGVRGVSELKLTLEHQDRASADYLKRFYSVDWNDAALYDVVINTHRVQIETAAQIIVAAIQQMNPAPA